MDNEDAWLSPVQTPLAENPMRPADEGEGKEQMYPRWIRVHSTQKVAAMEVCPEKWVHFAWGPIRASSMGQGRKGIDSVNAPGPAGPHPQWSLV